MQLGKDLLWLTESDISGLLKMPEVLKVIEAAFSMYGQERVQMPAKVYLDFDPYGGGPADHACLY